MPSIYLEEHLLYYIWKILDTYYKEQFIVIHLEEELFYLEEQHIQYYYYQGKFFSVLQWYQSKPQ